MDRTIFSPLVVLLFAGCTGNNPAFGSDVDSTQGSDTERGSESTSAGSTAAGSTTGAGGVGVTTDAATTDESDGLMPDVGDGTTGVDGDLQRCPGYAYAVDPLGHVFAVDLRSGDTGRILADVPNARAMGMDPEGGGLYVFAEGEDEDLFKIEPRYGFEVTSDNFIGQHPNIVGAEILGGADPWLLLTQANGGTLEEYNHFQVSLEALGMVEGTATRGDVVWIDERILVFYDRRVDVFSFGAMQRVAEHNIAGIPAGQQIAGAVRDGGEVIVSTFSPSPPDDAQLYTVDVTDNSAAVVDDSDVYVPERRIADLAPAWWPDGDCEVLLDDG